MTPLIARATLALLLFSGLGGAAPGATADLELLAEEGQEAAARRLAERSTARNEHLAAFVGLDFRTAGRGVTVRLFGETSPVARQTPHWISGFAVPDQDLAVLLPSRVPLYPHDSLPELLDHELLHVYLHRSVEGRPVPRWFNEGVALVGSRGLSLSDRGHALIGGVRGGPRSTRELEVSFAAGRRGSQTAYALSGAFVHDLLRRHGPGMVADVARGMRTGATFRAALEAAMGEDLETAEGRFFRRSRVLYTWLPWLTSGAGLWLLVTALALVAVRRKRQRVDEIKARWEAEERLAVQVAAEPPGDGEPEKRPPGEWIH